MAKKFRAEHIVIFAVYKKLMLFGNVGRYFKVAFPDYADAEKWITQNGGTEKDQYIIEEMPATMKAWQP